MISECECRDCRANRYTASQPTKIIDDNGVRFVQKPSVKERKPRGAGRFSNVAVGDQIMRSNEYNTVARKHFSYYIVTDLWFDPVLGQYDPVKGQMIGYSKIDPTGTVCERKTSTTVRGLASQRFQYADVDFISLCQAKASAQNVSHLRSHKRKHL